MPKAKSTSVETLRIEFQTKEREALDMIAASTTVRNIGQGIGAILTPFTDAISIVVGAIVAKEGAEYLWDKGAGFLERTTRSLEEIQMEAWTESDSTETFEEFQESRKKPKIVWFSGWGYWRNLLGYE